MRIKDKSQFALGIINILIGIAGVVSGITHHIEYKLIFAAISLLCGIIALRNGIETKRQRRKRMEEFHKHE